ncbi:conserved hypothetical protein, partial [Trichinella spiralis]|uniref:hypothetical protein n=1 Tax=Trichinella spiralis TaxID=6334 RepID=UPI0001EFDB0D
LVQPTWTDPPTAFVHSTKWKNDEATVSVHILEDRQRITVVGWLGGKVSAIV